MIRPGQGLKLKPRGATPENVGRSQSPRAMEPGGWSFSGRSAPGLRGGNEGGCTATGSRLRGACHWFGPSNRANRAQSSPHQRAYTIRYRYRQQLPTVNLSLLGTARARQPQGWPRTGPQEVSAQGGRGKSSGVPCGNLARDFHRERVVEAARKSHGNRTKNAQKRQKKDRKKVAT